MSDLYETAEVSSDGTSATSAIYLKSRFTVGQKGAVTMRVKHFIQIAFLLTMLSLGGVVAQAQDNRPHLRVVNTALGIPSADVFVDGTLYFQGVYYGYVSNYVPVDQGGRSLRVRAAGVENGGDLVVGEANFEGSEGERRDYTAVILDKSLWVFEDDNRSELRPGQTRVRVVNVSQGPAVEICLDDQCETLTFQRLTCHQCENHYISLDAGTYNFRMRLVGTDELYFDTLPITLEAGEVYSIFILDPKQGEVRPRIIPHADTGQPGPGVPGPGYPPLYPPVTGAFLSPVALTVLVALILVLAGSFWIVRRYTQTN
jgi:hypothetical protein